MNILAEKFREVSLSILPIFLSIVFVAIFFVDFSFNQLVLFVINTILLVVGLVFFLLGVDLGITPLGKLLGPLLAKFNKKRTLVFFAFIIGFIISFAEPSLLITAIQLASFSQGSVSAFLLVSVVSLGIASMVSIALIRIVFAWSIKTVLVVLYGVIFVLSFFVSKQMLAFSFDLSAVTTGVLSVPFLLALSLGITSKQKESKRSNEQSFGLLAIASAGAVITMFLLDIVKKPTFVSQSFENIVESSSVIETLLGWVGPSVFDATVSILPLFLMFLVVVYVNKKSIKRQLSRMLFGFGYAYIGLILFLISVNASYLTLGHVIGEQLINNYHPIIIIVFAFILGVVSILAEPGVYVLTHQIQDITAGSINRKLVLYTLAIGVGFAISISMVRILIPTLQLWHLLLPGYIISIGIMFFIDPIFVGMAFDAGGVATGPILATFILAFVNGAAQNLAHADLLIDGFGMVAMVALMPILSLQLLGGIYKVMDRRNDG